MDLPKIITEEARSIEKFINLTWKKFDTELEVRLKELFPEPKNTGLQHIWRYGSADIVVRKDGEIVCLIEPGGAHHLQDEKQMRNDRRKWKLSEINGVRCLFLMNGLYGTLSNRRWRRLIGRFLFGPKKKQI